MADTCVAMNEWVENPMADSAMKEILPCWDKQLGENILDASKSVTTNFNGIMNQYIVFVANNDTLPPQAVPLYYNQSGPLIPLICDPYTKGDTQQSCGDGQVTLSNAREVKIKNPEAIYIYIYI